MDEKQVKSLRDHLATLRRELAALTAEAKNFPALERNAARISASLRMMEISLGLDNAAMDRS